MRQGARVTRLPVPGGEVVFANPGEREEMYDGLHYAAGRRAGDFEAQLVAMIEVRAEVEQAGVYPTWTAVCIDRHRSANMVVEIQMAAYAPRKAARRP